MIAFFGAVYRRGIFSIALALSLLWASAPAFAQRSIGSAVTIEREVSGAIGGRTRSINTGDGVVSNENIRTANASAAQLQFLDQTKLSIGPSASVVLDRFVYNPDGTARQSVLRVTTGAARWVSGRSRPQAHEVKTPHAVIGVRGTIFDLLVEQSRTIVTLREGVIVVCPILAQQRCVTLDTPGQVVIVTPVAVEGPSPTGPSQTRFTDLCLRPVDRSLCTVTQTALLAPTWEGLYAGVHMGGGKNRTPVEMGGSPGVEGDITAGFVPSSLQPTGDGVIGGLQVGYSWQFGAAVFGVEADLSATSLRGREEVSHTFFSPTPVIFTTSASNHLDALGTIRGRAGIAVGDALIFGTGGLAVGHVDLQGSIAVIGPPSPIYSGSRSLLQAGFVVGGGVEYAISQRVSLRTEFLHYDLGTHTVVLPTSRARFPLITVRCGSVTRGDIVRAAVNMRF